MHKIVPAELEIGVLDDEVDFSEYKYIPENGYLFSDMSSLIEVLEKYSESEADDEKPMGIDYFKQLLKLYTTQGLEKYLNKYSSKGLKRLLVQCKKKEESSSITDE